VRQLYSRGDHHLSQVKDIVWKGNGSFQGVMTEMKKNASDVVNDALAIEIALLRTIEDTEACMSRVSSLSSPPSASSHHDNIAKVGRKVDISEEFCIGMVVDRCRGGGT